MMPSKVVVPRESLVANDTGNNNFTDEGLLLAVHGLMANEILFPEEGIFAVLNFALERPIFGFGVILAMMTAGRGKFT